MSSTIMDAARFNAARTLALQKPKYSIRLITITRNDLPSGATDNDFHISLGSTLKIVEARLVSSVFYNSQYPVNSNNNSFTVQTTVPNTTTTLTITPGIYDGGALATALQTAFNTIGGGTTFTVTFSSTTQKFTFTRTDGGGNFRFLFVSPNTNTMAEVLGFSSTANTALGTAVTSTYPAQLDGPEVMRIRCPQLENSSTASGDHYFAEVVWSDGFNVRHLNTFVSNARVFDGGRDIAALDIQFVNGDRIGAKYDLNGRFFEMGLEFICIS